MAPIPTLVPPRRLGILLRAAREAAGLELVDLVEACGLSVVELDDVEHGRAGLDDALLTSLVRAYGIEESGLIARRTHLVIDLEEGWIAADRIEIDLDVVVGPDAVLTRYLGLVYRLRDVPIGSPLHLRDIDIALLATVLRLAGDDIENRLSRLMHDQAKIRRDQQRIRRHLLVPLVGMVIAVTGLGTLVLVPDHDQAPVPETWLVAGDLGPPRIADAAIEEAPVVETDLGSGAAIEENPGN